MGGTRSALGRSLVPWRQPATAWAMAASLIILITAGSSHGLASGVRGAVVAMLAWATVRELAPMRAIPSLLAPFAAIACAIPAAADLLVGLAVLIAARIATRSTGAPPTHVDAVVLLMLAAGCALRPESVPAGLVLAAVVAADAPPDRLRLVGIGMLVLILAIGSVEGTLTMRPEWTLPPVPGQVLLAILGIAALVTLLTRLPRRLAARDDRNVGPQRGVRIRAARIVVTAAVVATIAWTGTDGAFIAASASAALLATGLSGARQRPSADPRSGTMGA